MIAMDLIELIFNIVMWPIAIVMFVGVMVAIFTRGRRCGWALEMQSPGYRDRYERRCRCEDDDDISSWL